MIKRSYSFLKWSDCSAIRDTIQRIQINNFSYKIITKNAYPHLRIMKIQKMIFIVISYEVMKGYFKKNHVINTSLKANHVSSIAKRQLARKRFYVFIPHTLQNIVPSFSFSFFKTSTLIIFPLHSHNPYHKKNLILNRNVIVIVK